MFRRREIENSLLEEVEITLPSHVLSCASSISSILPSSSPPPTSSYTRHSVMNDSYRTSHTIEEQLDSSHLVTITTHSSQILPPTPRIPVSKSPSTLAYISTILFPTSPPSSLSSSSSSGIPELSRTFSDDTISTPYYSQSDFSSSHWTDVAATPPAAASAIGMAIVATATVIVHPLVFIAGAATAVWAVGVFHAVERGYEFFADGTFGDLFWAEDGNSRSEETGPLAIMSAGGVMSPLTASHAGAASQAGSTSPITVAVTPVTSSVTSSMMSPLTSPMTSPPSPTPTPPTPTPNRDTLLTPSQLINIHFPPLDTLIISNVRLPGLTAPEFFSVFMSDTAPYSLPSFQSTSLNDIDVQASSWTPASHNTGGSFLSPPTDFNSLPGKLLNRTITFKTLTKSYFGTTYASAIKTQRASLVSKHFCVVESRTRLENIPFADRFYVLERWIVTAEKKSTTTNESRSSGIDNDDDEDEDDVIYESTLTVYASVVMTKSCTWEAQIRKKTMSTLTGVLEKWKVKALDALKHAEMRRRLRERGLTGRNNLNDGKVVVSSNDDNGTVTDSLGMSSPTSVIQIAPQIMGRSLKDESDEGLVKPHVNTTQKPQQQQQQQQQQHLKQEERLFMIHEETLKRIRTRIEEDGGVELESVQLLNSGDNSDCDNAKTMGKGIVCNKEDMAIVTPCNDRNHKMKKKWRQKGMPKILKNDILRNPYLIRVVSSIRK